MLCGVASTHAANSIVQVDVQRQIQSDRLRELAFVRERTHERHHDEPVDVDPVDLRPSHPAHANGTPPQLPIQRCNDPPEAAGCGT